MKINGNEIRPGSVIEHNNSLWAAVKCTTVKPGKGGAFNQVELKNLLDGTKLNERFRSSETVELVQLERRTFSSYSNRAMPSFSWTMKAMNSWNCRKTLSVIVRHF